jgi:hypothetical protein
MNRYYHNSDGDYRLGYITVMEMSAAIGASVFMFGLLLLSLLFAVKTVLIIGLAATALCGLGVRLIR